MRTDTGAIFAPWYSLRRELDDVAVLPSISSFLHAGLLEGEAAPGADSAAVAAAAADRDRRTLGGDQLFDLICALIFAVAVRP